LKFLLVQEVLHSIISATNQKVLMKTTENGNELSMCDFNLNFLRTRFSVEEKLIT